MQPLNLNEEQKHLFCIILDSWYNHWKKGLVDYETRTHLLGIAKEQLKARVCEVDREGK